MKIKKAVFCFLIWATVILLFKWFYNEIYQLFTPFLMGIPILLLSLWSAIFGIWAIIILVKKIKTEKVKSILPAFIFVFVVFVCFFVSFQFPKVMLEYILYTEKREKIVSLIQSGELKDDGIGNVKLPIGYRYISCDGEAYIYQNDEQGTVIGFWAFRGLLMNPYRQVVFTSFNENNATIKALNYPNIYEIKKLGEHWYYIFAK